MDKNPFSFLHETSQYPYARTLRTSVTQKMGDTFVVFTGKVSYKTSLFNCDGQRPPLLRDNACLRRNLPQRFLGTQDQNIESIQWFWRPNDWNKLLDQGRLGLFDYLTCGIPYFISNCLVCLLIWTQTLKEYHQAQASFMHAKLVVVIQGLEYFLRFCFILWNGLVHGVARALVGSIGLFFCGLLIGLPVAYFAERYAKAIKERAFQLQGICGIDNHVNLNDETISLNEFLLKEKIRDIQRIFLDSEQYQCDIYAENERYFLKISYPKSRHSFYAEIHQDNIEYFEHLFSLNFAHVVDTLIENKARITTPIANLTSHSLLFRSLTVAKSSRIMAERSSVNCL